MDDKKDKLTCEDVLNSIGNDEIFVRDESMNGLLVAFGHCSLWNVTTIHFRHYLHRKRARKTLVALNSE